jgi:hypothetical protein
MPTSWSGAAPSAYTRPFTRTEPLVGASSPTIIRIVMSFPAPLRTICDLTRETDNRAIR